MARKRKLGARIYTFFLVLFGLLLIAAACYGLLMVWTYAEEYEYTRPHHALDEYLEKINRDRWSDGMAEAVAAMPHETQTDEEIKAFIQDKLSGGVTAVRKGGTSDSSIYSLRCEGREFGTVTIVEDTSYRSRIDTTKMPWSLLQWSLYPWKVEGETFDFNALYNSMEVTVPKEYQVLINGVQLGSEYIVAENIPYDNYQKKYYEQGKFDYWYDMPTKVTYRFDHIIGEAEMEIRDAAGNPVTIDPNRGDEQFTRYASGDEYDRYEEFTVLFTKAYLNYISGAGDEGLRLYELKNYMFPDSELWSNMDNMLDGLSWAHALSSTVEEVTVKYVLPLKNEYTEVYETWTTKTFTEGKGEQTVNGELRVLIYNDGERLYAVHVD